MDGLTINSNVMEKENTLLKCNVYNKQFNYV